MPKISYQMKCESLGTSAKSFFHIKKKNTKIFRSRSTYIKNNTASEHTRYAVVPNRGAAAP